VLTAVTDPLLPLCLVEMTRPIRLLMFAICISCIAGCKTQQKNTPDIDALLAGVIYDTSVSQELESSSTAVVPTKQATVGSNSSIRARLGSFREAVVDGVKVTACLMLYAVLSIADAMLGSDDADDSRGRADRDLNQWIDDRDGWLSEG
jgi:hypothetical protein